MKLQTVPHSERGRPTPSRWAVAALSLLTACASPLAGDAPAPTGLPQDLGVQATVQPGPSPSAERSGGRDRAKGRGEEEEPEEGRSSRKGGKQKWEKDPVEKVPDAPEAPRAFRGIGSAPDPAGDAGLRAPAYADLTNILVEDDGQSARVSVDMAGDLPERLPEGEVEGVGVDLIRGANDGENDYQVFASGNADGWVGYLYAPGGFVRYRGTFEVIADRLVFTVPWEELGGKNSGTLSAFADWSGPGPIALNPASQDFAPNVGSARFG